jgi:hypothetical protein
LRLHNDAALFDVLRGVEHIYGDVFQQFFLGRQVTPLHVA